MTALLHLMHLVSPALPVGAYAYSQGLEYAIDSGWLRRPADIQAWLEGLLQHNLGNTDLPIVQRVYLAWAAGDTQALHYWNHYLGALRETRELLMEDEQLGQALLRLLIALEIPGLRDIVWQKPPSFASLFAIAGCVWQVPLESLLQGFAWSWLENQIAAATKLVPLGQTQAQQLLINIMPKVAPVCAQAQQLRDEDIGQGLPGLAMASCLHERQYTRLFRS